MPSLDREVYALCDDVSIYHVADEDHEDYIELKRQLNGEDSLFINPKSKDIMWQSVMESKNTETYSIFVDNQFCGCMELSNIGEDSPEIGIDLCEEKRNKGIGPKAITALARTKKCESNMRSFTVEILAENAHSQHVFEKLGAIVINPNNEYDVKDGTVQKVIEHMKEEPELRENRVIDDFLSLFEKRIIEYKLPLNIF